MSKNKEGKKQGKKLYVLLIVLVLLVIALTGLIVYYVMNKDKEEEKTLAYTELIKELSHGNIEKIEMTVGSTTIKIKQKEIEEQKTSIVPDTESFITFHLLFYLSCQL